MVTNTDLQKVAKDILENPVASWRYIAFNVSYLGHGDRIEKFKYAIQIVDLIYFYHRIQETFLKLGFEKEINTSILNEAINHVLTNKPFSDAQLTRFYELSKTFDSIVTSFGTLLGYDDYYLDTKVEHILIGLPQRDLDICKSSDEKFECDFEDTFFDPRDKYFNGEISVLELIKALKKVVKDLREKAAAIEIKDQKMKKQA